MGENCDDLSEEAASRPTRIPTGFILRPDLNAPIFDISVLVFPASLSRCTPSPPPSSRLEANDDDISAETSPIIDLNDDNSLTIENRRIFTHPPIRPQIGLCGQVDVKDDEENDSDDANGEDQDEDEDAAPVMDELCRTCRCIFALANGDSGLVLMDVEGRILQRFRLENRKALVYGAKLLLHYNVNNSNKNSDVELKLAALVLEAAKWYIHIYRVTNGGRRVCGESCVVAECPTESTLQLHGRESVQMRISACDNVVYVLGSGETCSAIWTLALPSMKWTTLLVERSGGLSGGRGVIRAPVFIRQRQNSTQATEPLLDTSDSFSMTTKQTSAVVNPATAAYSCFDVAKWQSAAFRNSAEIRILLCESGKQRLNVLVVGSKDRRIMETKVVKTKRSKELSWIVQGPRLAVWDECRNIIVFDGSGKVFCFSGVDYRIKKVIADMGRDIGAVGALAVAAGGWCFVVDTAESAIHAFYYL